jgi:hypothetical protein
LTFGRRFPLFTTVMVWLTMALPSMMAGVLLLVDRRAARERLRKA